MESSIQIFKNDQFGEIRTAGTADNPMFCLSDICKVLDLQTNKVKNRLSERGVHSIPTPTQNQYGAEVVIDMLYVNEQNLYKVIMRSDKPQAEPFQDWVCGEVLPSIRRTGGYMVGRVDDTPEEIMARAILVAQDTIARRDQRIKELELKAKETNSKLIEANNQVEALSAEIQSMKPKVTYYDMILNNKSTVLTTQIALDYGLSAKALNQKLYELRVQHKVGDQWILYAPYISHGYMHSKAVEIIRRDGRLDVKYNSAWTQKGRLFLYDILKKSGILPLIER